MKPKIAPTSPKYSQEASVEKLYNQSTIEQPSKRVSWISILLFTVLFGLLSGAVGMVLLNSLYQQNPQWPFWRDIRLAETSNEAREVIIRETGSTDRIDQDRQALYDRVTQSLLSVYQVEDTQYTYLGTGAFVTTDGIFVFDGKVNASTISGQVVAYTNAGKKLDVSILAYDPISDLSLGQVSGEQYQVLSFGVAADLHAGQGLYILSANRSLGVPQIRSTQLVSANASINSDPLSLESSEVLSHDILLSGEAAVSPGSIVVDQNGSLQGIYLQQENPNRIFPVVYIRTALQAYTSSGLITRTRLGVHGYDLHNSVGLSESQTNQRNDGFLLAGTAADPAVVEGGPASEAGLQDGDIIISVNGQNIDQSHSLQQLLQSVTIGAEVDINYLRDGVTQNSKVILSSLST
ncbi:MAG: serine protease [Candidatus Nomurabacteria bacterium]|nr:MAG: serine protease [Candidatus Nomurabacteria bacterium]